MASMFQLILVLSPSLSLRNISETFAEGRLDGNAAGDIRAGAQSLTAVDTAALVACLPWLLPLAAASPGAVAAAFVAVLPSWPEQMLHEDDPACLESPRLTT